MRTNVELDEELLGEAKNATGLKTKRAVIEEALKRLVDNHRRRQALDEMRGMGWEGDLDEMREGRDFGDWQ